MALRLGNRAYLGGLNVIGMKRAGMAREDIHAVRAAYKHIFGGEQTIAEAVDNMPEDLAAQ